MEQIKQVPSYHAVNTPKIITSTNVENIIARRGGWGVLWQALILLLQFTGSCQCNLHGSWRVMGVLPANETATEQAHELYS